ncbi:MAG: hypothetical protein GY842_23430 [bacterium]|nr:hypothetical protein [bacterium]
MHTPPTGAVMLTGCGWVTPFAAGSIATVLDAAAQDPKLPGENETFWSVPDERLNDCPELSKEIKGDRGAWVTAIALDHARREAGLQPDSIAPQRVGLVLGCALAGQLGMIQFADEVRDQTARFVSPIHFPQTVGNFIAGALARAYDIRGPNVTLSSGLASGLDAVAEGSRLLQSGEADVVYAGGTDCLSPALALGLADAEGAAGLDPRSHAKGSPASQASRLSEGACLFVLERVEDVRRRRSDGSSGLAWVSSIGQLPPDASGTPLDNAVVSVAGLPFPGAVTVEHWVGCCFAALGAAAVAAGVAAMTGTPVPQAHGDQDMSVRRIDVPDSGQLMVLANADGAHITAVELSATP